MAGPEANAFANREGREILKSKPFWKGMLKELEAENFLIGMDGLDHQQLRKMFAKSFSRNIANPKKEQIQQLCIEMFADVKRGQEIEMVDRILQLTSQMIGCSMTDEIPTRKELDDFLYYVNAITNHFTLERLPSWMLAFKSPRIKSAKKNTFRFADQVIDKHLAQDSDVMNFVDVVLEAASKCPHHFAQGDIRFSAMLPFFAGIDTLGQTINYALYELHKHPEILKELRKEVRDQWRKEIPDAAGLKKLPILQSVILETLRLHPTAFGIVRTAGSDFTFEGYDVRAGEDIVLLTTAGHFMDRYFKNPTQFDLSRYSAPRNEHHQRDIFAPYGRGPHTCLGAGLAETLMGLAIGSILNSYSFETLPPNLKIKERINPTPSLGKAFTLRMT